MPPVGLNFGISYLKIQVDYANHDAIERAGKLNSFKFMAGFHSFNYAIT